MRIISNRSGFERHDRNFYPMPAAAVPPLILHLRSTFAEPCCGDGSLVRHLEGFGLCCNYAGDIATGQDALAITDYGKVDAIITNPPYQLAWPTLSRMKLTGCFIDEKALRPVREVRGRDGLILLNAKRAAIKKKARY